MKYQESNKFFGDGFQLGAQAENLRFADESQAKRDRFVGAREADRHKVAEIVKILLTQAGDDRVLQAAILDRLQRTGAGDTGLYGLLGPVPTDSFSYGTRDQSRISAAGSGAAQPVPIVTGDGLPVVERVAGNPNPFAYAPLDILVEEDDKKKKRTEYVTLPVR